MHWIVCLIAVIKNEFFHRIWIAPSKKRSSFGPLIIQISALYSQTCVLHLFTVLPKLAPFAISDEPLHLGDYFQLTCVVVHGDFPYNITWYFNDEPITYIDGVTILMNGKRSSSLNIDSVSAAHSGNYSCIGSNVAGRASITTTLSIRGLCTLHFTHTRSEHYHQI